MTTLTNDVAVFRAPAMPAAVSDYPMSKKNSCLFNLL